MQASDPRWYYRSSGQMLGPVTTNELMRLASGGRIRPTDEVCAEMGNQWLPASTIPGLFDEGEDELGGMPGRIWRDGHELVFEKGVRLPDICLKTGAPATVRLRRTLYWCNPALYFLFLLSILIGLIVILMVRKSAVVELPLSVEADDKRKRGILTGWIVAIAGIGLFVLAGVLNNGYPAIGGAVALLFGIIYGLYTAQVVRPSLIDDRIVRLKGVCEEFLSQLPHFRR